MRVIEEWYSNRCNGEWEKNHGVHIETVAEGGWWLKVDLSEDEISRLKDVLVANEISKSESRDSWISYKIIDHAFVGGCAPKLLEALICKFEQAIDAAGIKNSGHK